MTHRHPFTLTLLPKRTEIKRAEVSAVFLVGLIGDNIVAARNERGWDIPGGHLNPGEELLDGLRREAEEEAGVSFRNTIPYAKLTIPNRSRVMIFFTSNSCKLREFTPKPDALERKLMPAGTLIKRYYGDKELLRALIREARMSLAP